MTRTDLLPLVPSIIYGPVRSRRLGVSLGVNVLPGALKACNFNCIYCQYGWTSPGEAPPTAWPSATQIGAALEEALDNRPLAESLQRITLAGHGEPTLHPAFDAVIDAIRQVRARLAPAAAIAILTNGTRLGDPRVRATLGELDERYVKLDAGTPDALRRVNGAAVAYDALVDGIRSVPDITLQSMFVEDPRGRCGNASATDLATWLDRVRTIRPARVHIYTLDRAPALSRLRRVSPLVLQSLADTLRADGIAADVFA